jgi:transcriptional regulator with XRE-family HTH domain
MMSQTCADLPPVPAATVEATAIRSAQGTQMTRSFADLLREYRRAAGKTQEELAERAGISPRALRKLESGASQVPRRDTMRLLAQALNLEEPERARLQASVRRSPSLATRPPYSPFAASHPHVEAEAAFLDLTNHLTHAVPFPYAEAIALMVHGDLLAARGEWDEALARHEAALTILSHLRKRVIAAGAAKALERSIPS